jgi:hypothetical protein
MKNTIWIAALFVAVAAQADSRQVEMKGRITEVDPLISAIRLENGQSSKLFIAPEDVLVRERLTRLSYGDLREGDTVAVRFWEDSEKIDRVDILQRSIPGTAVAQQQPADRSIISR